MAFSPLDRLRQIEDYWRQWPGAAPGGTGLTGLKPNDATGWSRLLNEQTEHQNLMNELEGQAPVMVRQTGLREREDENPSADAFAAVFNAQEGPYGAFGAGTGGIESRSPFAALDGLKKAKPTIKAVR